MSPRPPCRRTERTRRQPPTWVGFGPGVSTRIPHSCWDSSWGDHPGGREGASPAAVGEGRLAKTGRGHSRGPVALCGQWPSSISVAGALVGVACDGLSRTIFRILLILMYCHLFTMFCFNCIHFLLYGVKSPNKTSSATVQQCKWIHIVKKQVSAASALHV